MQNRLKQMHPNCMLHFAVHKFADEHVRLTNGKTNVKSQKFQANKVRNDYITA